MARNPHAFVGDYFYQESRKESVDINQLSARTVWILDTLAQNRPESAFPKYIFVLRDGLSEGQFAMVRAYCFQLTQLSYRLYLGSR